jgi:HK97 gp10 family phage protein
MSLKFVLQGIASLEKKIEAKTKAVDKAKMAALTKAAYLIRADAQALIQQGPKSGETYGNHRASAPGEPPATDTGNLVRSITVDKPTADSVTITCRAPYAAALEFGTDDGHIEERPFMRPAFNRNKDAVVELMKEANGH